MSSLTIDSRRPEWPTLLSLLPRQRLRAALAALTELGYSYSAMQPAADGFALLQLEDSCERQPFYLGELPIAVAAVAVTTPTGKITEGACQLMSSDVSLAEEIAVWDAILGDLCSMHSQNQSQSQSSDQSQEELAVVKAKALGQELLAEGATARSQRDAERQATLAATKVNFQMMDE